MNVSVIVCCITSFEALVLTIMAKRETLNKLYSIVFFLYHIKYLILTQKGATVGKANVMESGWYYRCMLTCLTRVIHMKTPFGQMRVLHTHMRYVKAYFNRLYFNLKTVWKQHKLWGSRLFLYLYVTQKNTFWFYVTVYLNLKTIFR